MALANIYSDPNYHNQNHWGILQALARKGVSVAEPNITQLTETILIQNSPLKMVCINHPPASQNNVIMFFFLFFFVKIH